MTFRKHTLYPENKVLVYDAEVGVFIPPITTSGLLISTELHPYIIVRAIGLEDTECSYLEECINQLMRARLDARAKRITRVGNTGSRSGNGGVASEDDITEGDGDSMFGGNDMGDGPDVRVIVVFGSSDGNDPDYVYRSSDEEGSEEEGEASEKGWVNNEGLTDDESDEAMETDCEDKVKATARKVEKSVTDLTWLSDN